MMDNHSVGALAQADIERYCDSVDTVSAAEFALQRAGDSAMWRAVIRLQILPKIHLSICEETAAVRRRAGGTITAVALGRSPVAAALQATAPACRRHAWALDDGDVVGCATWVDNVFAVGRRGWAALELLEAELKASRNLPFKPST